MLSAIDQNTLVVFSSDNGPSIEAYLEKEPIEANFFNSLGPFDGIKRDLLEGGRTNTFTIAEWPAQIKLWPRGLNHLLYLMTVANVTAAAGAPTTAILTVSLCLP